MGGMRLRSKAEEGLVLRPVEDLPDDGAPIKKEKECSIGRSFPQVDNTVNPSRRSSFPQPIRRWKGCGVTTESPRTLGLTVGHLMRFTHKRTDIYPFSRSGL